MQEYVSSRRGPTEIEGGLRGLQVSSLNPKVL